MTQEHLVTPPPELVREWITEARSQDYCSIAEQVAFHAAQWGADQALEACCEWFIWDWTDSETADRLRDARRSKPPSLKEQALEALAHILNNSSTQLGADTIRRALEQLPDCE